MDVVLHSLRTWRSSQGNINPSELSSAASLIPCELKSSSTLRKEQKHTSGGKCTKLLGKAAAVAGSYWTWSNTSLSILILLIMMSSWCISYLYPEETVVSQEFV